MSEIYLVFILASLSFSRERERYRDGGEETNERAEERRSREQPLPSIVTRNLKVRAKEGKHVGRALVLPSGQLLNGKLMAGG